MRLLLQSERDLRSAPTCRSEERSRCASRPDGNGAGNDPAPAERASVHLHLPRPSARASGITDQQDARAHRRRPGVGICSAQGKRARAGLAQRACVLNYSAKGSAEIVCTNRQRSNAEENLTVAFKGADGDRSGADVRTPLPNNSISDFPPLELPVKRIVPPPPPLEPPLAVKVEEPAVELSWNVVSPPAAPLTVAPSQVITELPAPGVWSMKDVLPPNAPLTVPALFVIVAVLALVRLKKIVSPPSAPGMTPPLLIIVASPAFDSSTNCTMPTLPPGTVAASVVKMFGPEKLAA